MEKVPAFRKRSSVSKQFKMSSNSQESSSSDEFQPETVAEYLQRKKVKFLSRVPPVKEESQERSDSPVRAHPPPVKSRKYVPPSAREAGIPKGFKRSTCDLGHPCHNALCYTHTSIRGCVWDRKKYPKPYIPSNNNVKKFDVYSAVQEVEDLRREAKARRQVKALKNKK